MANHLDGKRPVTVLAGPYGHPFHPILVTVPIGAWVSAFVFDIASRLGDDPAVFSRGAYWLIGIGVVGALGAAVFGLLDLLAIAPGTRPFRTALVHMTLNLAVVAVYAIAFVLRGDLLDTGAGTPSGLIALSAVALALLGVSGWLGGRLTYRFGVRVADQTVQSNREDH